MLGYLALNFLAPLLMGVLLLVPFMESRKSSLRKPSNDNLFKDISTSIMFSTFLITFVTFLGALIGIPIRSIHLITIASLVSIIAIRIYREKLHFLKLPIIMISLGTLGGFLQYFPVLLKKSKIDTNFGMISHGNNDIANYTATAAEFLDSGFSNSQHFLNLDLNSFALNSAYQTPNGLLAFTSTLFNQKPFVVSIPVMIFAIAFSIIAISAFTQSAWPKLTSLQALFVGWLVNTLAITTYIQSHYFLAQIITLGLSAMILESAFTLLSGKELGKKSILQLGALISISLYTYPHFLIPFMALVYLTALLYLILFPQNRKMGIVKKFLIGAMIGFLFFIPYLKYAISLALEQAGVTAGWRMLNLNPFYWIIGSTEKSTLLPNFMLAIMWSFFLIIAIATIGYASKEINVFSFNLILTLVFIISYLVVVVYRGGDFLEYSSWKLLSYFFPLLIAMVVGALLSINKSNFIFYTLLFTSVTINPNTLWSIGSISTTNDDVAIQSNSKVLSQRELQIDLDPYFQTMQSASLLSDTKLHFKSLSYWPSSNIESICVLINSQNNEYSYKFNVNSTYSLASNSLTDCKNVLTKVRPGDTFEIESLKAILGNGWSQIEPWGVWSDISTPSLLFEIQNFESNELTMTFNWLPFLTDAHEAIQVEVLVNKVKVKTIDFEIKSLNRKSIIKFASRLCETNQNVCEVQFKIREPKSPASLGLSNDARELGLGLTSIKLSVEK